MVAILFSVHWQFLAGNVNSPASLAAVTRLAPSAQSLTPIGASATRRLGPSQISLKLPLTAVRQLCSGCCRSRRRAELTVLATLPSVGTRADGGGMTGIESTADSDAVNAGPTAIRLVHDGLSHISPFEQVSKPYLTMLLLSARSAPWRYM